MSTIAAPEIFTLNSNNKNKDNTNITITLGATDLVLIQYY